MKNSVNFRGIVKSRRFARDLIAVGGAVALGAGIAWASEQHLVTQQNKAFSEEEITIKVGDSVRFLNEDNFAHNVFSLSETKFFDLGSFGNGGDRSITFEEAGVVEVECAVHPDMFMTINVE